MAFRIPEKDELASKLINYPLLNSILRMFLYEKLFRVALIGFFLLMITLGLIIAKIWTATPAGFTPVVKLRGLDYLQAWSLQRTALKQMAAGKIDESVASWRMAVQNNPGNPELLRGSLNVLFEVKDKRTLAPTVLGHTRWLLRLTQTNRNDLELSVRLYQACGLDDLVLQTLRPELKDLSPALEGCYLRALFNRGFYAQFAARWEEAQQRGVKLADSALSLYHDAYLAGWGTPEQASEAARRLEGAKADPATRVAAHRLQLKVSERLAQANSYRASLLALEEAHQDHLEDHIGYWQLLARVGRKSEALDLMNTHVAPPVSGEETVLLAKAHFDLGQQDKSRQILERYAPEYADSEAVWVTYANLLTQQQRWEELGKVALFVRHEDNPLRDALAGYSYYIEGLSELGLNRRSNATNAFSRIAKTRIKTGLWEFIIAEKLDALGFPGISKDILLALEKDLPESPGFWMLLAKTAFDAKDPDVLVSAVASLYKLRPDDPMVAHNYAAALIATRQQPEQALKLTSKVLERQPQSYSVRVNHSLALLQNRQTPQAEAILQAIDPGKLQGAELTSYYLALFELNFSKGRYEDAKQAFEKIQAQYLLPPESQWLEKARLEMTKTSKG